MILGEQRQRILASVNQKALENLEVESREVKDIFAAYQSLKNAVDSTAPAPLFTKAWGPIGTSHFHLLRCSVEGSLQSSPAHLLWRQTFQ